MGEKFESHAELEAYITNFYKSLYRHDETVQGEIEEFLGPDVLNHPLVRGSILTDEEKINLDKELNIAELDTALEQSNLKSSPGMDGFSYRYIKKFWQIYREPLYKCAKNSLENQTLPDTFLTAQIKLIPKKGDSKKIGNWRPISLLSNFYKIVSRLINNRLKGIANRILSRAQKGFNNKRYIQESILNVLENIDFCKKNNIKGALVTIDQAKAFDSVSHDYMVKVYNFFGFGERIKNWLKSIGTGRRACIITSPGEVSETFDLEKGHAQGDSPSPLLYNFAAQILLFKIELDKKIKPIRCPVHFPGPVIPLDPFLHESNRETGKCDCFADDNTVQTILDLGSLRALKIVLGDFKVLSGLKTNYEKTGLMRVGDLSGEIEPDILALGFKIETEIKLLGFTLSNQKDMSDLNFVPIAEKIGKIIRFWERFYLSLPGKITVYKTLLLPQLNYVATILTPSDKLLSDISKSMESFVTQGLSIAKNRLYAKPEEGGLGLFNLKIFIKALQATWVSKAYVCCNDNWKYDLLENVNFDLHNFTVNLDNNNLGGTLSNLSNSFSEFLVEFSKKDENFIKVPLLNNLLFKTGGNNEIKFDATFFGAENAQVANAALKKVTWEKITRNDNLKGKDDINILLNCNLSNRNYEHLKRGWKIARKKYGNGKKWSETIEQFVSKEIKGSKRYRTIIDREPGKNYCKILKLPQLKTFKKLTGIMEISEIRAKNLYGSWNKHYLASDIKVFLFKFYNNILGTNLRVSKFNYEISPACTFCTITGPYPANREDFSHVFFHCPTVKNLIEEFFSKYMAINVPECATFFGANLGENEIANKSFQLAMDILRFHIWSTKLEKKIPNKTIIFENVNDTFSRILKISTKISIEFNTCSLFRNHRRDEPP